MEKQGPLTSCKDNGPMAQLCWRKNGKRFHKRKRSKRLKREAPGREGGWRRWNSFKTRLLFEEYLQPKTYIVHFLTSSSNAAVSNDAVRYSLSLTGRKKRAWQTGADPGIFLGGGALVSCSTLKPINHIVFFLQNTSCIRKPPPPRGRTPWTLPLDPPLRLRWLDPVFLSTYLSPSDLLYVNSLVFVFVLIWLFSWN